jgi:alpha-amylase/alpha-mannosidase (GH57 family)
VSALFCIHGHFYQPAREHPWLDVIEVEDTAAPFHDWNARITAECYAPNAAARILDAQGRIDRIVNNYAATSFNFGPTLLRWLEQAAPEVYAAIVRADQESTGARGFGNAIAQPYNHVIMPLASRRDKMTQVRWGIADFRRRFGRPPDGMWLPETAVDRETLAVLAECGIAFTILSPHQAARVRAMPAGEWVDVSPEMLDVTRPYLCRPAPGLRIAVFFYERTIAREIAFGGLLKNGEHLADRLWGAAAEAAWTDGRLAHVATDGETYGHHHQFGEMALAYAIHVLEGRDGASFTNYAACLADYPPSHEVEIHDFTAWSCPHGVERWRADCGCRTRPDWHQRWRAPLRAALDWLKTEVDALFEDAGGQIFHDPWAARDAYIDVVLGRTDHAVQRLLSVQALQPGVPGDRRGALRLLEMQRHAMLMFSSDGWFFDELSRIETVQILRHAARVIQLAGTFGRPLEAPFLERLRPAESNLPIYPDGVAVYDRLVRPAIVDARRVAAHYAITSLFREYPERVDVYAYRVTRREAHRYARGARTLLVGRVEITETSTAEASILSYAVLYVGGTDVHCCVRDDWDDPRHQAVAASLIETFEGSGVTDMIRQMDAVFGREFFTLRDLFTDERRDVMAKLSEETTVSIESAYRRLYDDSRGLMAAVRDADVPVPREFLAAAEFVLTTDIRRALASSEPLNASALNAVAEARAWGITLSPEPLEPLLRARIERVLRQANGLFMLEQLADGQRTLDIARDAGITVNLWQAQNLFHVRLAPRLREASSEVRDVVEKMAERLNFSLDALRAHVASPS